MDLLADRLAEIVRLGRCEAGQLLGDLHVLLLIDAQAESRSRDRVEALVGEGHLLAAVLARGVGRDVLHRARPVEGDERDQVLELGRLDLSQRFAHPGRLELEHAARLAAREHLVRPAVVERHCRHVETVAHESFRGGDHVEVAQAEEVHLQQAERLDVAAGELRYDLLVGALLLQWDDVHQRLGADHDAGGVDGVRPRQPFERLCEIDDLLRDRVGVDRLPELGSGLQSIVERLSGPLGHELRDAVDDAVRDLEHPPRVTDGGPRGHGGEGDDLGDAVAPVLLRHVVDHAVATGHREVDVGVRERLATGVEEALEQQVVADRVDVRDVQAVGDEAARGRATTGTDADAVSLGEADEIPDDQEVVDEAHLTDRLELVLQSLGELGGQLPVPAVEPELALLDEIFEGVAPVRRRELGEQNSAEIDGHVAPLGDLERPTHRVLVTREVEGHLVGRLEVELVRLEAPVVRVLQRVTRLDAEQCLVRVGIGGLEVVDVAGGDNRQLPLGRERGELGYELLLHRQAGVLELDVHLVSSEQLLQPVELRLRILRAGLGECSRYPPGEAARESDQPSCMALQELPVDTRAVVVALQVSEGAQLDQVAVTLVRCGEQRQVRVTLVLLPAVVDDVYLTTDQRLDPLVLGRAVQVDRTRERPVIGERDSGHLAARRLLRERRDAARPVQDRELGVNVEVDER